MFRQSTLLLAAMLSLLVTACTQEQEVLPTLVPTFTSPPVEQVATETPVPTDVPIQSERPTLPPTWTPTTAPATPALAPTATFDENLAQGIPAYADTGACDQFRADLSRSPAELTVGEPLQVHWFPVLNVAVYRITLFTSLGVPRHTAEVTDTTYTFPAGIFEANALYGWEVIPYDANGVGMCPPRGSEVRTRLP